MNNAKIFPSFINDQIRQRNKTDRNINLGIHQRKKQRVTTTDEPNERPNERLMSAVSE